MNEMMTNLKNQGSQFWGNLTKGQKITFSVILGLFIIGATVLSFTLFSADYTEVARDLDPRDASEIVEVLEDRGVSYQLQDGGSTILVPRQEHDNIRLDLAGAGLPRGGVLGYEDLDTSQLGLTESERELRQKIALEGELVRTIRRYPEVEDARVHLVLPERSLFDAAREDAKSAVFLDLKPQRELSQQQIKSIVNLVAHSVEGLQPEKVTLTSGQKILSDEIMSADNIRSSDEVQNKLAIQSEFQNTLRTNLESMLEDILGTGNVTAQVNADLNFDEVSTFSELFEPVVDDEGILVSMHQEEEFYSGEGMGTAGIPGDPADGTPEYPEGYEGGEFEYERTDETRNYEVNRIEEKHRVAPGTVDQLSVAVAVNREMTEEELTSIENLVRDAIGIDIDRDQISVEQMDFDTTLQDLMAEQMEREQQLAARQQWITIGAAVVGLIVLLLVGRKIYQGIQQRRAIKERLEQERLAQQETAVEEPQSEVPEVQKQITKFAEKKPDEFAKVLKAWLAED